MSAPDEDESKRPIGQGQEKNLSPEPGGDPAGELPEEAADRTVIADMDDGAEDAAALPPDMEGRDRTIIALDDERALPPAADPTVVSEQPSAASAPVRLVEPGTLINNNYRIIELISAGGMGEVYRAANVFTGDFVAVKVILGNLANDETVLDMFRREARVLVQLRHDAIVRYHNFVLDGGLQRYCLIMEYVEGRHLGTRVKNYGPLPDQAILALIKRLASGLARAHASGVTHRDLSPDNVILRDDRVEEAVLIDFGIARSTELGDGLAGRFAGKFKYIAPEQLGHWDGVIGPQTDVYGLGLLAAMVARGTPLDMGDSVVSASAARQTIPSLDGLSHRLFPILQHMLEPDPAKRPGDMNAVLRILDDPQQLPAQYRLPLWSSHSAGDSQADGGVSALHTTGAGGHQTGNLTSNDLSELTSSHSPFGALTTAQSTTQAPPVDIAKPFSGRMMLLAATTLTAILAASGVWWVTRDQAAVVTVPPEAPDETDMVPRDLATREGFLAQQPLPDCAFALRMNHGAHSGQIVAFGPSAVDMNAVVAAYDTTFGVSPAVVQETVSPQQCAVLDFLHDIAGRPAPSPTLSAGVTVHPTSFQVQGAVQSGDPSGERNLWLFLVSPNGGVYDLTNQLQGDGGGPRNFGISVQADADAAAQETSYLMVAVTSANPLASVSAATAGAPSDQLLPRVLAELRQNEDNPALDVFAFSTKNEVSDLRE